MRLTDTEHTECMHGIGALIPRCPSKRKTRQKAKQENKVNCV